MAGSPEHTFLTLKEACYLLRISKRLMYRLIKTKNDRPPCRKIGGVWRFPKTQFCNWAGISKE